MYRLSGQNRVVWTFYRGTLSLLEGMAAWVERATELASDFADVLAAYVGSDLSQVLSKIGAERSHVLGIALSDPGLELAGHVALWAM